MTSSAMSISAYYIDKNNYAFPNILSQLWRGGYVAEGETFVSLKEVLSCVTHVPKAEQEWPFPRSFINQIISQRLALWEK